MAYDPCHAGVAHLQQLAPALFKPKGEVVRTENYLNRMTEWKVCPYCEQETPVKKNGFFYHHSASIKGHVTGETAKLSGKPARTRGRKQ